MKIDFQLPGTNPALQRMLTNQYINRDGNGVAYTIGGHSTVNKMQRNLMVCPNNVSMY